MEFFLKKKKLAMELTTRAPFFLWLCLLTYFNIYTYSQLLWILFFYKYFRESKFSVSNSLYHSMLHKLKCATCSPIPKFTLLISLPKKEKKKSPNIISSHLREFANAIKGCHSHGFASRFMWIKTGHVDHSALFLERYNRLPHTATTSASSFSCHQH